MMTLALHQNTAGRHGYRESLEGWARAGIKYVELTTTSLDEFMKTDSLAAATHVLEDSRLTAVSCAIGGGLYEPNPNRANAIENLQRRCEMLSILGVKRFYATTASTQKFAPDDYKTGAANMHEVGEIAKRYGMTAMVEFVRTSTFVSTLPALLKMTREAAHPNMHPMLDCYHFWSNNGKLEDLDLLRPGELAHVHFQDTPDLPHDALNNTTRVIPGDGVAPLTTILKKLADKGYAGALSVELFAPEYQEGDPYEIAVEIRTKAEAVMRQAGVL